MRFRHPDVFERYITTALVLKGSSQARAWLIAELHCRERILDRHGVKDLLEMQIAVPGGSTRPDEQARALRRLGAQLRRQRPEYDAPPVLVLPTDIERSALGTELTGAFVVSGISLMPTRLPIDEGVFIVAGPMRTGKTPTLITIGEALRQLDPTRSLYF